MTCNIAKIANGVTVILDPMDSLETAALGIWAHAGSVDEREDEHGLAHLLEHMAFKGTKTRSARQIAEEIEAAGGYLNASTSQQRTGYYARVLKDDMGLAIGILADILQNPLFENSELEKEKDVIVQEIGEAADRPDDVVFELLQKTAWDGHALARPILGTPQSVRKQSGASLRAFMGRNYNRQNLVIAAAGRIDEDAIMAQLQSEFSAFNDAPTKPPRAAPEFKAGIMHDTREIEQTHLALAFPGVAANHEDYFATRIFTDALGGGLSSRLFQKIREERGIAYSVYAFADGYDECGLIGAYAGADESRIVETAQLIMEEIEAMAVSVESGEIDRARAMLRSSYMVSLESPAARIEAAAGQFFTYGEVLTPEMIGERLDSVTIEDVKRCAARALDGNTGAIALVGRADASAIEKIVYI